MAAKLTIVKGEPIPTGRYRKYPFGDMAVGDKITADSYAVVSAAYQYGNRHDMKFGYRKNGNKFDIWRIR